MYVCVCMYVYGCVCRCVGMCVCLCMIEKHNRNLYITTTNLYVSCKEP